jgi:acylphosphatase
MSAIRRRVLVSGHVQGVFFRASCAAQARARGLSGSVRNLPDGRVEAVFEGPAAEVDALVSWCRRGPSGARVDRLEVIEEPPHAPGGFTVA